MRPTAGSIRPDPICCLVDSQYAALWTTSRRRFGYLNGLSLEDDAAIREVAPNDVDELLRELALDKTLEDNIPSRIVEP